MTNVPQHELKAISQVYELLARIWIREVDAELFDALRSPDLSGALNAFGLFAPSESLEDLAAEYCRLFVGPRDQLPPIQSVWQRAQLQSEAAVSVGKFADMIGLAVPEGVIPDHLGFELGVMSKLVGLVAESEGSDKSAREAAELFYYRHLTWASPLLLATRQRAELPFYGAISDVTQQFLRQENLTWSS